MITTFFQKRYNIKKGSLGFPVIGVMSLVMEILIEPEEKQKGENYEVLDE